MSDLINRKSVIKVQNCLHLYDKNIELNTSIVNIPFGLEKVYNNYILKLELNKELEEFILNFESFINNRDEYKNNPIKSSLIIKENYKNMLNVKIPSYNTKINATIKDRNGHFNLFNLEKNTKAKCKLVIDSIWNYKGINSYKIKLKELLII